MSEYGNFIEQPEPRLLAIVRVVVAFIVQLIKLIIDSLMQIGATVAHGIPVLEIITTYIAMSSSGILGAYGSKTVVLFLLPQVAALGVSTTYLKTGTIMTRRGNGLVNTSIAASALSTAVAIAWAMLRLDFSLSLSLFVSGLAVVTIVVLYAVQNQTQELAMTRQRKLQETSAIELEFMRQQKLTGLEQEQKEGELQRQRQRVAMQEEAANAELKIELDLLKQAQQAVANDDQIKAMQRTIVMRKMIHRMLSEQGLAPNSKAYKSIMIQMLGEDGLGELSESKHVDNAFADYVNGNGQADFLAPNGHTNGHRNGAH